jgi:outer membrane immunogenic protein
MVDHMKRLLIYVASAAMLLSPLAAHSADLPVKAPPPPAPVFTWTGIYVGANIGGAWSDTHWTDAFFPTNFNSYQNTSAVFIGGGQIGGNYQIGNFVVGGEWDIDWASNGNPPAVPVAGVGSILVNNNNRWITTVAARFGFAVDHSLLYLKAGGGWVGDNNLSITNQTTGVSLTCGSSNLTNCGNNGAGWLIGVGWEYAVTNNWTVKLEYDYLGLGNRTVSVPATAPFLAGDTFTSNSRDVQMVKVGFNYLFNWGAPVAAGN